MLQFYGHVVVAGMCKPSKSEPRAKHVNNTFNNVIGHPSINIGSANAHGSIRQWVGHHQAIDNLKTFSAPNLS